MNTELFKKAQSSIFYITLISLIAAGVIRMSMYLRQSIQGKIKESADVFGGGVQYESGVTVIVDSSEVITTPGTGSGGSSWSTGW